MDTVRQQFHCKGVAPTHEVDVAFIAHNFDIISQNELMSIEVNAQFPNVFMACAIAIDHACLKKMCKCY